MLQFESERITATAQGGRTHQRAPEKGSSSYGAQWPEPQYQALEPPAPRHAPAGPVGVMKVYWQGKRLPGPVPQSVAASQAVWLAKHSMLLLLTTP